MATDYYFLEDVPWTMYFNDQFAPHGSLLARQIWSAPFAWLRELSQDAGGYSIDHPTTSRAIYLATDKDQGRGFGYIIEHVTCYLPSPSQCEQLHQTW
jgi:hypothetical protein